MQSDTQTPSIPTIPPTPTWMRWIGWVFTLLPAAFLFMSAGMKFTDWKPPEGAPDIGWSPSAMMGLAIVEIGCTLLYLFPSTAVLGAILLTGYLGGAVATHVRIGDMFLPPILVGVLLWFGLLLRDGRLRACLPWRRDPSVPGTGGVVNAFGKILLTLVVLAGVIAALIVAQPPEFRVTRSATIDATPAKVFEQVNDFHKWEAWSPWAKRDRAAKNSFEGPSEGTGAIFKWSGNDDVGEGRMEVLESKTNEFIKIKLDFVRPRVGTSVTEFTFKPNGNQTVVKWTMTGQSQDFIGKAFALFAMDHVVGGDFETGLANMKSVVETK